jgi:hypothetical protein
MSVLPSVCPYGTTRLPLDGSSWFLVNDQLDAQFFPCVYIFNSLHVSSTSCSSSGETNCVNTTCDNCNSLLVAVSCAGRKTWTRHGHRQLPDVVLTQFVSPEDEHDVLETGRELKIKINTYKGISASRWPFTKNHYMMHGQRNIKFWIFMVFYIWVFFESQSRKSKFH